MQSEVAQPKHDRILQKERTRRQTGTAKDFFKDEWNEAHGDLWNQDNKNERQAKIKKKERKENQLSQI